MTPTRGSGSWPARPSRSARGGIERAAAAGRAVLIPAISRWELARLSHEGRLKLGERPERWFDAALAAVSGELAALTPAIALTAAGLHAHADPADRLIIATAIVHGAALVTRDQAVLELAATRRALRLIEA
ncbi:type II toxin-antitoxin system VapC family toxin [Sorangium cellulosum]|uniref:type II toxin-antitoxin system VapC family toxin n=1 Tax=Sorangium cellulosum TaxID=56 RepID=UPI0013ED525E